MEWMVCFLVFIVAVLCVLLRRAVSGRNKAVARCHELSSEVGTVRERVAMLEDELVDCKAENDELRGRLSRKGTGVKGSKKAH